MLGLGKDHALFKFCCLALPMLLNPLSLHLSSKSFLFSLLVAIVEPWFWTATMLINKP